MSLSLETSALEGVASEGGNHQEPGDIRSNVKLILWTPEISMMVNFWISLGLEHGEPLWPS